MLDELFDIATNHKISAFDLLDMENIEPLLDHI